MRDWERRLLDLERGANALAQEIAALRARAGKARQDAPRGRFYVYAPPLTYDPCLYAGWATTLTWDFQGICPAGVQDTRTITKSSDLGTILGTSYDGVKGWIGDPDEYPGLGRSSYRFVSVLSYGAIHWAAYAVDDGAGGFDFSVFTTFVYCRTHKIVTVGDGTFPAAWVS